MATTLEGGERLVLKTLLDLGGEAGKYVEEARLATATRMFVQDVRDWLETLGDKGFVERARLTDGFSAYVTAKGKQALRLTEPIAIQKAGTAASNVSMVATPSGAEKPLAGQHVPNAPKTSGPIRLFYSYAHEDERLRKKLEQHLKLLQRQGLIAGWHDRMIGAGDEWKGAIDKNLEEAQVILLLVSSSFLGSDYCWDVETRRAVERHDRGEAKVIPVILRPCDWHGAPFAKLQALPKEAKPVTSWSNRDEAWTDIARGIRRAVEAMTAEPNQRHLSDAGRPLAGDPLSHMGGTVQPSGSRQADGPDVERLVLELLESRVSRTLDEIVNDLSSTPGCTRYSIEIALRSLEFQRKAMKNHDYVATRLYVIHPDFKGASKDLRS